MDAEKKTDIMFVGALFFSATMGTIGCGVGLFMIAVENMITPYSFVRLGLAVLGLTLIGAVIGAWIGLSCAQNNTKEDEEKEETNEVVREGDFPEDT